MKASGAFEVTLTQEALQVPTVSGLRIAKTYLGPLSGTGSGCMLAVHGATAGSAGYVAMEHVEGTLDGRAGTFALQHSGTMQAGREHLSISVVPDSGTGALAGLAGEMTIVREGGVHRYSFDYTL